MAIKDGFYAWLPEDVAAFEEQEGRPLETVGITYTESEADLGAQRLTWNQTDTLSGMDEWFGPDTPRVPQINYDIGLKNPGDYQYVLDGGNDDLFNQMASDLVDLGVTNAHMRLSSEFSAPWGDPPTNPQFPDDPTVFGKAFAHTADIFTDHSPDFTFAFGPANTAGPTARDVAAEAWDAMEAAWDSPAPLPTVAPTFYNDHWSYPDDLSTLSGSELQDLRDQVWADVHEPMIGHWISFANQRGTTFGLPEWGTWPDSADRPSGGDDPTFVHRTFNKIENASVPVEYQTWWNSPVKRIFDATTSIDNIQQEQSARAWFDRIRTTSADMWANTGGSFSRVSGVHVYRDGSFSPAPAHIRQGDQFVQIGTSGDTNGGTNGGTNGDGGGQTGSFVFITGGMLNSIDISGPQATQYDNFIQGNGRFRTTTNPTLESVQDWTDHQHNNDRFVGSKDSTRQDYGAALRMAHQARDCALAYWFTGDDAYARATIDTLAHWCLKPDSYMVPEAIIPADDGGNVVGTIRKDVWVADLPFAASFVRGHPHWDTYSGSRPWDGGGSGDAESAFHDWLRHYHSGYSGTSTTGYSPVPRASHQAQLDAGFCWDNNRCPWWTVTKAAIGSYVGDDAIVGDALAFYQDNIWQDCQYQNDRKGARQWGGLHEPNDQEAYLQVEFFHPSGQDFDYTTFHYHAKSICCLIFEAYDGTDMWSYNAATDSTSNPTLERLLNWGVLREAMLDTSQWRDPVNDGSQSSNFEMEQAACLFEIGNSVYGGFGSEIETTESNASGRPHFGKRVLGPVTLLYGV